MASSWASECSDGTSGEEAVPVTAEEERRNWLELPREVTASILGRLIAEDVLGRAQLVCKAWLEISKDPLVWKRIDMYNLGDPCSCIDWAKMFYCAVDRSCGQAVDVNIEYFGDDDILKYLTDRSTRVKRLRLTSCYHVSEEGLIKTVEKLPLLEELELTLCSFTIEPLEAVGRLCPLLKSFKLNSIEYKLSGIRSDEEIDFNEEAIAIGKNMPQLCHLQLIGNSMTDKGLKAILDGCTKLESLDLRRCLNISLSGSLWKRCTKQVKHLRLPYDSTKDYPFQTGSEDDSYVGFFSSDDDQFGNYPFPLDFDYDGDDYASDDDLGHPYYSGLDDQFDYDDFTLPDNYW